MNIKFAYPKSVLIHIKTFLEERLRENQKRVARLKKEDPFSDTDRLNDNASVDTEANEQIGHERVQALKKELEESEKKIKKALWKIKKSKYGFCEKCGKMIDTERLEAFPMAELCVTCQNSKEK